MRGIFPSDLGERSDQPTKTVYFLGLNWISLERHGGRADLLPAEWLAPFTCEWRLQETQIESEFIQTARHARQGSEHSPILFAWIRLCGDRVGFQAKRRHDLHLKFSR